MSRPQTKNQHSVESMLASIRQAIHSSGGKSGGQGQGNSSASPVSASMREMRVSLQGNGRNGSVRQHADNFNKLRGQLHEMDPEIERLRARHSHRAANGFAGILSGDVRLEDALAKLERAGLDDTPVVTPVRTRSQAALRGSQRETEPEFVEEEFQSVDEAEYGQVDYDETEYAPEPAAPLPQHDEFSEQTRQSYLEPAQPQEPVFRPEPSRIEPALRPEVRDVKQQAPQPLTSTDSTAAASQAFAMLADTIVDRASTGDRSIDDMTKDLLRPMLQSWLDENLPTLVETLVREEIERVARWGGKK